MKTITMDYETYEREIREMKSDARLLQLCAIARLLEDKDFELALKNIFYDNCSLKLKAWKRIYCALGREDQWNHYEKQIDYSDD